MSNQCRTYAIDGEPVVVRGDRLLTAQDIEALAEITRAARTLFTPEMAAKQDAARERHHARLVRLGIARPEGEPT